MPYQYLSIIGLALDILGVCMLFNTGIPPDLDEMFDMYVEMPIKEEMKPVIRKRTIRSKVALGLIIVGSFLQAIATYISIK